MKIGIIGATGKAGSMIAREARYRRHEVTAIVRNRSKIKDRDLKVLEKDLFDLTVEDLKPFDAVVDAFGTAFDPESAKQHQSSLKHLSSLMEKLPGVRLMVVGGAASLYTDRTHRHRVLESIPADWQAVPANMKAAFEQLQTSGANWTYFSPAATFDPKGPRTGKVRLGRNEVIPNSEGESYLSYADYAVAMLDEIEEGRFIRKRFTAVSEKVANKDGYFGTESKKPVFEGISTYRPHLNYELVGRNFHFVMDNSKDILVSFLTGDMLEFSRNGQTYTEHYECAKGAENAYFVNLEISYADYAVAMVDEIERGNYIRRRFTAVSDSRPVVVEKPYLGIRKEKPEFEGLSQYRDPFNYELVGKTYQLAMDDGKLYAVTFVEGHLLRWGEVGAEQTVEHYDCAKVDDSVYFVNFEFANRKPRTNISLVMDTDERLVTMATTITGYHPKFPYMVDSQFVFGVLDVAGYLVPTRRHKYTADLLGKRILWHYSPEIEIVHVYYATDYMRVTQPDNRGFAGADPVAWQEMMEREPYDEPAAFIKIRPGLYFVSCTEKNMACRGMTGNSMMFVIDTRRVHDVGRSFGHAGLDKGRVHPENYMFSAFGEFVESDGVLESQPNIYREKQVT